MPYKDESSIINQIALRKGAMWAAQVKAAMGSFGIGRTGKLLKAIKDKYHYDMGGEVDRISISLIRYGIMVEKGAGGRGFGPKQNSEVLRRIAKPFISSVMTDEAIKDLADEITIVKADAEVKSFKV